MTGLISLRGDEKTVVLEGYLLMAGLVTGAAAVAVSLPSLAVMFEWLEWPLSANAFTAFLDAKLFG